MKQLNMGIPFDNDKMCILLYADNIVIFAEDPAQLQLLLTNTWCKNWKMKINKDKTKIVHYRKKSISRSTQSFFLGNLDIEIDDKYKYLGIFLDEFFDFKCTASTLSGAADRTLGSIILKFKSLKNVGFETFSKLYHSGVAPIMDYYSGIWGYGNLEMCQKIQQCAIRFYLGVHPKTPLLALEGDVGSKYPNVRSHTEMLRFWNRVLNMDESRLTRQMFEYDYKRCKINWCNDMKQLFNIIGKMSIFEEKTSSNIRELQICNHNIYMER